MNKDVIKKYWKEFQYWVNGGEVLAGSNKDWIVRSWIIIGKEWTWQSTEVNYVINDEYVEFRKALAEGKTVQLCNTQTKGWCTLEARHDFNKDKINFIGKTDYRIKPDEPEFKVGDYVVGLNSVNPELLSEKRARELKAHKCIADTYRLWTLEESSDDEWVLFKAKSLHAILLSAKKAKGKTCKEWCVPYIGQLPKQLGLEK